MSKGNKDTRTRNWTVVVYPESAPENWRNIFNTLHIEGVVSPLHDSDTNGAEEEKKAHWHVLIMFGGVKSYQQVLEAIQPLNCPAPQRVHSVKSLVRYFLHLDQPDKHQYNASDLEVFGGVDIQELLRPSMSERYTMIADILDFIDNNELTEFTDLLRYARTDRREDWFPLLCDSSTYLISTYLKSRRHQKKEPDKGQQKEPDNTIFETPKKFLT